MSSIFCHSYVKYLCEAQREKPKALTLFGIISVNLGLILCDYVNDCFHSVLSNSIPFIRIHGLLIHRSYMAFLCAEVMER